MSKKQPIYIVCGTRKNLEVRVVQGEIIDLTNNQGITVQIGLICRRPYWFATHIESGLDCTPIVNGERKWKKGDLIEALKTIDFKRILEHPSDFKLCKEKIADFKKSNETPGVFVK